MKNKEAIAMSKYPDGQKTDYVAPIEREDWPAPPAPAAAYPELCKSLHNKYKIFLVSGYHFW